MPKVIGAGFGRTGTDSMREALNMLGVGPCHHMFEVLRDDRQRRMWRALARGGGTRLAGAVQGVFLLHGLALGRLWRELVELCPEAKVNLTWRTAESWWASFERTILAAIKAATDPGSLGVALVAEQVFGGRPDDRAHAIATYEAHVEEVKAAIPPERLLVYPVGSGWGPLCRHLRLPVPEEPFPRRASRGDFHAAVEAAERR